MALNVDKLLKAEVRRLEALQRYAGVRVAKGQGALPGVLHLSLRHFAEVSFEAHRALVEAWGSWRFHGPVGEAEDLTQVAQVMVALQQTMLASAEYSGVGGRCSQEIQTARNALAGVRVSLRHYQPKYATLAQVRRNPGDYSVSVQAESPTLLSEKVVQERYRPESGYKLVLLIQVGIGQPHAIAPIRVGQKISTAVLSALEEARNDKEATPLAHVAYATTLDYYTRLFSKLGEAARTVPFAATLSCAPSSFLRLGEYGEKSCYRNGGEWELAKHVLALSPHTVVGLFYRGGEASALAVTASGKRVGKVAGRCWGVLTPRGFLSTNHYLLGRHVVQHGLKELAGLLCTGAHVTRVAEAALSALRALHARSLYCNEDLTVVHAATGFNEDVERLQEYVLYNLQPRRKEWHDPCCVRTRREVLLQHLRVGIAEPRVRYYEYTRGGDGHPYRRQLLGAGMAGPWQRVIGGYDGLPASIRGRVEQGEVVTVA